MATINEVPGNTRGAPAKTVSAMPLRTERAPLAQQDGYGMAVDTEETDIITRQEEHHSAHDTAGWKEIVFETVGNLTLSQIFPPDGRPRLEHDALIRIVIRLLLPELFPIIFGKWSLEDDLASIELLDLQRYSQPSHLGAAPSPIGDRHSFLTRQRTRSVTDTLLPKLQSAYHGDLSSTQPLYVPLGHREIRLLRFLPQATEHRDAPIRCELLTTTINTPIEPYDAVSYCWGPKVQQQTTIIVNGHQHQVNETLYHVLHQFRSSSRLHWIDALSIRQDDLKEKSYQIPLMGEIYTGATTVKIWLGADEHDSAYVLDCIRDSTTSEKRQIKFLEGLCNVLKRPWFTRVWVAQELVLASPDAPVLMSGNGYVAWHIFAEYIGNLTTRDYYLLAGSYAEDMLEPTSGREDHEAAMERLRRIVNEFDRGSAALRLSGPLLTLSVPNLERLRQLYWEDGARSLPLTAIFVSTRRLEASDPKDRVYGSLGMAGHAYNMEINLCVDYTKSIAHVFRDTTVAILGIWDPQTYSGILYSLPIVGEYDKFGTESSSWMLNFSFVGTRHADQLKPRYSDPSLLPWKNKPGISDDGRVLELKASYVDVIIDVLEIPRRSAKPGTPRLRPWHLEASSMTIAEYVCHDMAGQKRENAEASDVVEFVAFLRKAKSMFALATGRRHQANVAESKPFWQLLFAEIKRVEAGVSDAEFSEHFEALTGAAPDLTNYARLGIANSLRRFLSLDDAAPFSFFTTQSGICGLCTAGAKVGDELVVLLRGEECAEVPFVTRKRKDSCHSMITVAWVQSDWEQLCKPQPVERYRFR